MKQTENRSCSDEIRVQRRVEPLVPAGHPDFRWTPGADVQATWRRYGWVPVRPSDEGVA